MKFYTREHRHFCGHRPARPSDVCMHPGCSRQGVLVAQPRMQPAGVVGRGAFRDDLVVAVECMFAWVTGWPMCVSVRALFSCRAACTWGRSTGARPRTTRSTPAVAAAVRGGMLAQAYVYPPRMRATRDLLRRRCHLVNKHGGARRPHPEHREPVRPAPAFEGRIQKHHEREGLLAHFPCQQLRGTRPGQDRSVRRAATEARAAYPRLRQGA